MKQETRKPSTSFDVARRAGVSRATVSYVFNGRKNATVPEDTRQRVLAAARELGYQPNASARAIRRGRFGSVALLLSDASWRSLLPRQTLDGILTALAEHDLHLTVTAVPDARLAATDSVPKILREYLCDGLLINLFGEAVPRLADAITRHAAPAVWFNAQRDSDSVFPDDLGAGRQAAETLIALGHRRIAYAAYSYREGGEGHYSMTDRRAGYAAAMEAAGLPPRTIIDDLPSRDGERLERTEQWLSGPDRPTAVITYGPSTANAIYLAATARLRLRVPEDLSLMTFHEAPSEELGVWIATLLIPAYQVGLLAGRRLIEKIEAPDLRLPSVAVPFTLEPGRTIAPPGR